MMPHPHPRKGNEGNVNQELEKVEEDDGQEEEDTRDNEDKYF
jgi:hypothetical protein